jgi:hypothetical protein
MHDAYGQISWILLGKHRPDFVFIPNKYDFHAICSRGHYGTNHIRGWEFIAAHGINNNTSHKSSSAYASQLKTQGKRKSQ